MHTSFMSCMYEEKPHLIFWPTVLLLTQSLFGVHFLHPKDLYHVGPASLLWLTKTSKRLSWPLVTSEIRSGPQSWILRQHWQLNTMSLHYNSIKMHQIWHAVLSTRVDWFGPSCHPTNSIKAPGLVCKILCYLKQQHSSGNYFLVYRYYHTKQWLISHCSKQSLLWIARHEVKKNSSIFAPCDYSSSRFFSNIHISQPHRYFTIYAATAFCNFIWTTKLPETCTCRFFAFRLFLVTIIFCSTVVGQWSWRS